MPWHATTGIVGVLLAAGWGRRHGGDKLSEPLPDGSTVAMRAARQLRQGGVDGLLAVVRPTQQGLAEQLRAEGATIVWSEAAAHGMGHSLAAAVQATAGAAGWVVALADMPMVRPSSTQRVVQALREGAPTAVLRHAGQRGHPVGWSAAWAPSLSALTGDQGGRTLLQAQPQRVTTMDVDDPGILIDVDTPEALQRLRARWTELSAPETGLARSPSARWPAPAPATDPVAWP